MTDFVHLHLHSEYSLLDGACRIEELLDRAVQLEMPALAITEHGNMFSSVIFHDQARKRGINPILGCEVYVAPGDRRTKSGTPGETANHLVLLAATNEGYHNLIKLVSSGYTEGFYYKPRIDKDLLAQHATGLIGLSSCLKGEVATGIRTEQQQKAMHAAAAYRDILGAGELLPRDAVPGHRRAEGRQRRAPADCHGISGLPLVVDQRRPLPAELRLQAARHAAVHRHRQGVNDTERLRYHGDQFYLKTAEEMAQVFQDYPGGAGEHGAHRRAVPRRPVRRRSTTCPNFDVPAGIHARRVLRARGPRRASSSGCRGSRSSQRAGVLKHTIDEYERRLAYEVEMIKQMKYPGTS